jgi:pimeloyl-ACP methyl ester carboxylesterase
VRRVAAGMAVLLLVVALIGATYETLSRRRARRDHPPPGRLIDIGGRRIQVDCRGMGSPTVVLESGLDRNGSLSWVSVHDPIAETTRTCAYSRAGMMWSDAAKGPFNSARAAEDLHTALIRAGERPPWVMVGHSAGGPYTMVFTGRYPSEVAGLVFVDIPHPDHLERVEQATGISPSAGDRARKAAAVTMGPLLVRLGVARLAPMGEAPHSWTDSMIAAHRAFFPSSTAALLEEVHAFDGTLRRAGRFQQLGSRPLVVLSATGRSPAVRNRNAITPPMEERLQATRFQLQQEMATWSSRSRHEPVDAGHNIQFERPDVVIRAVRNVVVDARALRNE